MIQKWIRRLLGRVAQWMIVQEHRKYVEMHPYRPELDVRLVREKSGITGDAGVNPLPESCRRGEHDWRYIASPYVRQCKVKACGSVAFFGEVPDGLKDYINEMTSPRSATQAHVDVINANGGLHVNTSIDLGPFNDPLFGEKEDHV